MDIQIVSPFFYSWSYFFILALVLLWVVQVYSYQRTNGFSSRVFLRDQGWPLLFPWLMAAMIALSIKPRFNIPSGEMNMLMTSKSMLYYKSVSISPFLDPPRLARVFIPRDIIRDSMDVKPFLFPFLLSLIHRLLGYRPSNVFLLNFLAMGSLFTIIFVRVRRALDLRAAYASSFLLASCPLFSLCGRSGAADPLFTLFMTLSILVLYGYMNHPTPQKLAILWTTLIMTAYIREESFAYFFLIFFGLIALGYLRRKQVRDIAPLAAATPLFFLPLIWQRVLKSRVNLHKPADIPWFSVGSFRSNLADFLRGQIVRQLPYNIFIHWVAGAIFLYLFFEAVFFRPNVLKPIQKHFALLCGIAFLYYFVSFLAWCWPHPYSSPVSARFFLPFVVLCAAAPLIFLATRPRRLPWHSLALLGFSLFNFVLYYPIAIIDDFSPRTLTSLESDAAHSLLKRHANAKTLVITSAPWRFADLDREVIDFDIANQYPSLYIDPLQRHAVQEIFVMQRVYYTDAGTTREDFLFPAPPMETLEQYQTTADAFIRISRIAKTS